MIRRVAGALLIGCFAILSVHCKQTVKSYELKGEASTPESTDVSPRPELSPTVDPRVPETPIGWKKSFPPGVLMSASLPSSTFAMGETISIDYLIRNETSEELIFQTRSTCFHTFGIRRGEEIMAPGFGCGAMIRRQSLVSGEWGESKTFDWNQKNGDGNPVPKGEYSFYLEINGGYCPEMESRENYGDGCLRPDREIYKSPRIVFRIT